MSESPQKMARQLRRQGFLVANTNGGHFRISHPAMSEIVFAAKTASDHRAQRSLRAELRRAMRKAGGNEPEI